ncbi:hypothetical protein Bca101_007640 [Brassica carinata]
MPLALIHSLFNSVAERMVMEKHTIDGRRVTNSLPHMTSTRTRNFDASIFWLITEETLKRWKTSIVNCILQ